MIDLFRLNLNKLNKKTIALRVYEGCPGRGGGGLEPCSYYGLIWHELQLKLMKHLKHTLVK
jgi:hypothetical protein